MTFINVAPHLQDANVDLRGFGQSQGDTHTSVSRSGSYTRCLRHVGTCRDPLESQVVIGNRALTSVNVLEGEPGMVNSIDLVNIDFFVVKPWQ